MERNVTESDFLKPNSLHINTTGYTQCLKFRWNAPIHCVINISGITRSGIVIVSPVKMYLGVYYGLSHCKAMIMFHIHRNYIVNAITYTIVN